jgi:hypothetical protein
MLHWTTEATMTRAAAFLLAAAVFTMGSAAAAEGPKSESRAPRGVIWLDTIVITKALQKPLASIDVARIPAKLVLAQGPSAFVGRIADAIASEPF